MRHRHAVRVGHALRHGPPVGRRAAVVPARGLKPEAVPRLTRPCRADGPGGVRPYRFKSPPRRVILPKPPLDGEQPDAGGGIPAPLPKVVGLAAFTADEVHVPVAPYPQHHRGYAHRQRRRRREMKEFPPHNHYSLGADAKEHEMGVGAQPVDFTGG